MARNSSAQQSQRSTGVLSITPPKHGGWGLQGKLLMFILGQGHRWLALCCWGFLGAGTCRSAASAPNAGKIHPSAQMPANAPIAKLDKQEKATMLPKAWSSQGFWAIFTCAWQGYRGMSDENLKSEKSVKQHWLSSLGLPPEKEIHAVWRSWTNSMIYNSSIQIFQKFSFDVFKSPVTFKQHV